MGTHSSSRINVALVLFICGYLYTRELFDIGYKYCGDTAYMPYVMYFLMLLASIGILMTLSSCLLSTLTMITINNISARSPEDAAMFDDIYRHGGILSKE